MQIKLWMLAIVALTVSGCFFPADRGRMLEERVEKITQENKDLAERLRTSEERNAQSMAQVSKTLESLDNASRRSDADMGVALQKSVEDVASLRGQVETYQNKMAELETALKQATEGNEKRTTDLAAAPKEVEAKKTVSELKKPETAKDFLVLAEEKAKAADVPLARALYNEFLKKWPKDNGAGEAHFGLGETYFTEDRCREALYEYGKVIQEFGKTKSAPQAYLRSSDCFKKLKMTSEAKLALNELIKSNPKSDAAKVAKTRLQSLEKSSAKKGK